MTCISLFWRGWPLTELARFEAVHADLIRKEGINSLIASIARSNGELPNRRGGANIAGQ